MSEMFRSFAGDALEIGDQSSVYRRLVVVGDTISRAVRLAYQHDVPGVTPVIIMHADRYVDGLLEKGFTHARNKTMQNFHYASPVEAPLGRLVIRAIVGKRPFAITTARLPENEAGLAAVSFTTTKVPGLAFETSVFGDGRLEQAFVGKNPFFIFKAA